MHVYVFILVLNTFATSTSSQVKLLGTTSTQAR